MTFNAGFFNYKLGKGTVLPVYVIVSDIGQGFFCYSGKILSYVCNSKVVLTLSNIMYAVPPLCILWSFVSLAMLRESLYQTAKQVK